MLRDDAHRLAEGIDERVNAEAADKTITAKVHTNETKPGAVPPGSGRPTFIRYRIVVGDGKRIASLDLGQAQILLDSIEPGCDAEQVFDAVRAQDVPIEDAPDEDEPDKSAS